MSGIQDQLEIRFRLTDGLDIGPKSFPAATSVSNLKESILAQWPKGWLLKLTFLISVDANYLMSIFNRLYVTNVLSTLTVS